MHATLNLNPTTQKSVRLTTTLHDVMSALHTVMPPNDDDRVVATVAHWLESGWITWLINAETDASSPIPK